MFVVCSLFVILAGYATGSSGLLSSMMLLSLVVLSHANLTQRRDPGLASAKVIPSQAHARLSKPNQTFDQEQLFRRVFDHAAGMALVSPSGQWVTVNRSLCEALGYSDEELPARSLQEIAHPD